MTNAQRERDELTIIDSTSLKHAGDFYPLGSPMHTLDWWRRVFRAWRQMRRSIAFRNRLSRDVGAKTP